MFGRDINQMVVSFLHHLAFLKIGRQKKIYCGIPEFSRQRFLSHFCDYFTALGFPIAVKRYSEKPKTYTYYVEAN